MAMDGKYGIVLGVELNNGDLSAIVNELKKFNDSFGKLQLMDTKQFQELKAEITNLKSQIDKVKASSKEAFDAKSLEDFKNKIKKIAEEFKNGSKTAKEMADASRKMQNTLYDKKGGLNENALKLNTGELKEYLALIQKVKAEKAKPIKDGALTQRTEFSVFTKDAKELIQVVEVYKNSMGQVQTITSLVDKETKELIATNERLVTQYKNSMVSKFQQDVTALTEKLNMGGIALDEYIKDLNKLMYLSNGAKTPAFANLDSAGQLAIQKELTRVQTLQNKNLNEEHAIRGKLASAKIKEAQAQQKLNFDMQEFKKMQMNRLEILGAKGADSAQIDALRQKIQALSATTPQLRQQMKGLSDDVTVLGTSVKKTGSMMQFLGMYFGIYAVINTARRAITSMVSTIYDLDSALISLQKVTDLSGSSLKSFTEDAYLLGSQISKSGSDVIKASTEFAKAGYDESQIQGLAKSALILTSIGDGMTDVGESAGTLIAVLRGFGKETRDVTNILDMVNNVSNNASVGFEDITMALQRMSGTMHSAGVGMEESIGMFTAINEVLRNTEMTSTSLNTLSMRIRGLSEDGEAIDGLAPKLEKMYKTMAGVDLTDSNGQLRNMFDILKDLAPKWDGLTTNQKQYIAQQTAGVRQAKSFLILMDNFDRALETTELAYDSAGSSAKEFGIWQESLEGKLNNLKSAWEQMATTSLNSGFVKGILDITTGIVKLIDACGGLLPVLVSVGVAFAMFKFAPLAIGMSTIASAIMTKLVPSLIAGTTAKVAFDAVMTFGLSLAVVGIIMAIGFAFNHTANQAKKARESIATLSEELADLKTKKVSVEEIFGEYEELKKLSKEQALNTEEQKKFVDVQNQLKEIMPSINGFYNEQGDFIVDTAVSLKDLNKEMREYIALKRDELAQVSNNSYDKSSDNYKQKLEELKRSEEFIRLSKKNPENLTQNEIMDKGGLTGEFKNLEEAQIKQQKLAQETRDAFKALKADITNIIVAGEDWDRLTLQQQDGIRKFISEIEKIGDIDDLYKALQDSSSETVKALAKAPEVLKIIEEAMESTANGVGRLAYEMKSLEDSAESFKSISDNIKSLQEVLKDLEEGNGITADSIDKIIKTYPELIAYVGDEVALRSHLIAKIEEESKTQQNAYNQMLMATDEYYRYKMLADTDWVNTTNKNISALFNKLGVAYSEDVSNYQNAEMAKASITEKLINSLGEAWSKYFNSTTGALKTQSEFSASGNGWSGADYANISKAQSMIDTVVKQFDSFNFTPVKIDAGNIKSGGSKDKKGTTETEVYAKYLEKGLDDAISIIQSKGDKLAKEIELLDSKIALASAKGNVELTKELEEQKTLLLDKQLANISDSATKLASLKAKWVKELQAQNLPELKGVDLQNITQEQLNAISRAYEAKISQMTKKTQAKQKASLEFSKGMFEEFAKQIIEVNSLISQAGHDSLQQQITNLAHATEKIGEIYNAQQNRYDNSLAQIELEQILMDETSDLYVAKEKEKCDLILELQKATVDSIVEYRKKGLSDESAEVKSALAKWLELEKQYRQQQRKLAEKARQDKINSLKNELDTLKEQQESIITLHELVMKFLKQEANQKKESLREELETRKKIIKEEVDGYTKVIDARKKSLQKEVTDKSYEKGLKERQKKVSDVEAKILQLQFDNSDAGKAKKKLLADELKTYQEELEDYQYQNSIDKQTEALDKELERYKDTKDKEQTVFETNLQAQIKGIEDYLSKEGQLRLDAIALIESGNRSLYDKLIAWNKEYGSGVDSDISNAWNSARSALAQFNNGQLSVLKTFELITAEMKRINEELKVANQSTFNDYIEPSATNRPNAPDIPVTPPPTATKPDAPRITEAEARKKAQLNEQAWTHKQMVEAIATKNEGLKSYIINSRKQWGMDKDGKIISDTFPAWTDEVKKKWGVYHTGGVVGGSNQLKLKSNEEFAKLLKGEVVVNSSQMDTFMKNTLPKMISQSGSSDTPKVSQTFQINVEGSLDKSVLPLLEEWAIKIQNNTIGALNGTRIRTGVSVNALKFAF